MVNQLGLLLEKGGTPLPLLLIECKIPIPPVSGLLLGRRGEFKAPMPPGRWPSGVSGVPNGPLAMMRFSRMTA